MPLAGGAGAGAAPKVLPDVTFVLDISGSMGPWVKYSRQAIYNALLQLGYPEATRIRFITFTDGAVRVKVGGGQDPTIKDLITTCSGIVSSGGTNVAGVFPLLPSLLRPVDAVAAERPQLLVVISDGEIQDKDQALRAAQDVLTRMGPASVPICGVLLRTMTSTGANPSTQALACFGSFCTERAELTDVQVHVGEELGLYNLTQAIVSGGEAANVGSYAEIQSADGSSIFRRLPGAAPMSGLRIQSGKRTYLLVDSNIDSIMIDGKQVTVEDGGVINSEESFMPFLEFVDQQLRMWTLMGAQQADVTAIKAWLQQLQAFLGTLEVNAMDDGDLTVLGRARKIKKLIKKRQGSILDRILQMEGGDRVKQMNAQQQADWLRRADDNRSGRSLARRAQKAGGGADLDYNDQVQTVVRFIGAQPAFIALAGEESSFYSLSTGTDGVEAIRLELLPLVDDLTIGDVLQVGGLVGVPFEAPVGDYTDPYGVRVRNVYSGQYLGEQDVWVIRLQAGSTEVKFACPGRPKSNITGVIALRRCNPRLYDFMTSKSVRPLFEMQTSAQLRHMVSVVPQDAIALNVSAISSLVHVLSSNGVLTSVERQTLEALIENVMHLIGPAYNPETFTEMYASLRNADVRPWLSGDRNVSNVLKVFAVLVRYYVPGDATVNLSNVLRALYYLDTYYAIKRVVKGDDPNARPNLLKVTLGIDLSKRATPVLPLFEQEPPDIEQRHYDQVVLEELTIPQSVLGTRHYCAWDSVLSRRGDSVLDEVHVLGLSGPSLRAVATVQALQCANEGDRINTANRTCALPDPKTDAEALAYLRGVVRSHYAADYATRLATKRQAEAQILLEREVKALIDAADYETFKRLLLASSIANRDHKGFQMVLSVLVDLTVAVPARHAKLILLATGRELAAPAEAVWANGNFMTSGWDVLARIFEVDEPGRVLMVKLRAMRKEYGVHKYRGGAEKPNRHHHSDDFPSYWAMGYKDLYDFMSKDPEGCKEYVRLHCKGKGCCMPNESERKDFL